MGSVFLAEDTQLGRQVALKVPLFGPDDGPEARERFFREARTAATLDHPYLCPVYDVGEIEGRLYLTMALIEGKSLAQSLKGDGMPTRQVAALVGKLALALQQAHAMGGRPSRPQAGQRHDQGRRDPSRAGHRRLWTRPPQRRWRLPDDQDRSGHGHPGVHESRAAHGRLARDRPALRHLRPGRDPLRTAHGPAAVQCSGAGHHRPDPHPEAAAADVAPARARPPDRGHLPQGDGQEAERSPGDNGPNSPPS